MINLKVPEAFALDYLSILEVKWQKDKSNFAKQDHYLFAYEQLAEELGKTRLDNIIATSEYEKLYDANRLMYEAVEIARYGEEGQITPKQWDTLNMERHEAKKNLQKTYWGNELTETKT